jgi:predicted Zn-dependent protease
MKEKEARALLEKALGYATADATELTLTEENEASTRFANNTITQNIARANARLLVKSAFDNRVGMVRINRFDDESLSGAVRRAEEIARLSAPDTEYMPPVEPAACPYVEAWDEATERATPEFRARVIREGIAVVEQQGQNSAGSFATDGESTAFLNSRGHFAYHRATTARYICTAMTADSSGWAQSVSNSAEKVDGVSAAERASRKANIAANPRTVEPKPCTVILEPAAVADLLGFLAYGMDAKAADEGRSAFSGKLGQRIAAENITLYSQPDHPECPGSPIGEDGIPAPAVRWIENGALSNLSVSRFWAHRTGRPYTGSPANFLLSGGSDSLEKMIASTPEGILVTRFWYIRYVDPMKMLLTGMTRDGLFLIREGQIVSGLKNMRFNDSPLRVLSSVTALGAQELTGGYRLALMPAIKAEGFVFSSGTEF